MSQWFRMYGEVLNDPKVQRLSGDDFKGWVNLLCLASVGDGTIPPVEDVAFSLRLDVRKARSMIERLIGAGLIVSGETGMKPHNWDGRQFKSDVSTERVKRFRERSKPVSETQPATAPDTETDTEQSSVSKETAQQPPVVDPDKAFWDASKAYVGPSKASLIGKWISEYGRPAVIAAITASQAERAMDPVQFITVVLRKGKSANAPVLAL